MDQIQKECSDESLAYAISRGDREAFKILYYRYYRLLIHFAWNRIHSSDMAADLVQELFYKIWVGRTSIDPQKSIKAYLYKALNNLIINQLKHSSSQNYSYESISNEANSASSRDIELEMDVKKAMDKLPEKVKTVYLLSRLEGYKYQEIAEICQISVKAVEKRMAKAFEIMKKIFNKNY